MTMIHFQDSDLANQNKHDRGFKTRPLTDMIADFQQFGILGEYLAVDEVIVKYYGHNSLRKFIHGKLEIFGCKLWALYVTSW